MKKIKKFLWRFFPLVVCCCIIFSFATSASAANYVGIDYQDYIQDVSYNSDSKIVHTMFSWQLNYLQLTQNNKNIYYEYGTYDFVCYWSDLELSSTSNLYAFSVTSLPLGNRMLKLDNFPKDTEFTFSYRINENRGNQISCKLKIDFQWYDKDFNYIGFSTAYEESRSLSDSKLFDVSVPLKIKTPSSVEYLRIRVLMDFIADHDQNIVSFSIYPGNLYLDIPLSSIMIQEEQNQKIVSMLEDFAEKNDIIIDQNKTQIGQNEEIIEQNKTQIDQNKEIIDQNQTQIDQNNEIIDQNQDLIDGTPQQNQQVNGAVGGLENSGDRLSDLSEDMKVEKPDLSGVDVSPDAIVSASDRSLLTAPLTKLWEDPTILGMVTTVFILVLVSWVFFGKKG